MRWAATLNLFLPGAGLFYLGKKRTGSMLAIAFLVCLVAALGIFVSGYIHYLNVVLGGDIMKEGELEQLKDVFHKTWLLGLVLAGIILQVISMIATSRARPAGEPDSPPARG